jgi:Domain of unknown function (DUF932)
MSLNSNYLSKARGTVAISDEELQCLAPSIFASQPIEGVSHRYSFLPTSSILKGMRENGWVPVRAEQQSVRTEARRGFQKHLIRFARVEYLDTWEKNQVRPEVVLLNSHDKSSAYQLHCLILTRLPPVAWAKNKRWHWCGPGEAQRIRFTFTWTRS